MVFFHTYHEYYIAYLYLCIILGRITKSANILAMEWREVYDIVWRRRRGKRNGVRRPLSVGVRRSYVILLWYRSNNRPRNGRNDPPYIILYTAVAVLATAVFSFLPSFLSINPSRAPSPTSAPYIRFWDWHRPAPIWPSTRENPCRPYFKIYLYIYIYKLYTAANLLPGVCVGQ